jgi:hypothetical protein
LDTDGLPLYDTNGEILLAAGCNKADEIQVGIDEESRVVWKGENYELTGRPVIADPRTGEMDLYVTRGIRDGR